MVGLRNNRAREVHVSGKPEHDLQKRPALVAKECLNSLGFCLSIGLYLYSSIKTKPLFFSPPFCLPSSNIL